MSADEPARRVGAERRVDRIDGYAIASVANAGSRMLAKVGNWVLDVDRLQVEGLLAPLDLPEDLFREATLNRFMSFGREVWRELDRLLTKIVGKGVPDDALFAPARARLHRPVRVADFCDFYASEYHATNMGRILRPGSDPLPAAWRFVPLGYHGRSGTVVESGTLVRRPYGMVSTPDGPRHQPTGRLDLEVELGYVIGTGSEPGEQVSIDEATDHIFGVVLLNDWSARDVQAFEYQPLGPFLGKSFATSISPWVIPFGALDRFKVDGPVQGPEVPDHLKAAQPRAFDIHLELSINDTVVSRPQARWLHWSAEQLVAHLTSNGASLATGDLLGTGTISGPDQGSWGSLMELSWGGERPVRLGDGSTRAWLEDGDTVTIRGWCGGQNGSGGFLDFGSVTGKIWPSAPDTAN